MAQTKYLKYFLLLNLIKLSIEKNNDIKDSTGSVINNSQMSISYAITGTRITFDIIGQGTGYVGLGFSNSSGMTNSDIFIGWIDADGNIESGDYTSRQPGGTPALDEEQNWQLISGIEQDGQTMIRVSRDFDTGDTSDVQITNRTMTVIWALHPTSDNLEHHGVNSRGETFYNFYVNEPEPTTTTEPPPIKYVIIDTSYISISYFIVDETITFDLSATTVGYIGFGFSNSSGMVNSDMFIGGVNSDGSGYGGDYTSRGLVVPISDVEQNWELIEAVEDGGRTSLTVSRLLNTGDVNDVIITDRRIAVVWAFGFTDELIHHGVPNRGQIYFNIIQGVPAA